MPSAEDVIGQVVPHRSTDELGVYAATFAKLVDRHPPNRDELPSDWLRQLPNEIYPYYQRGIETIGAEVSSPVERRGRLYLVHTTLLFLWMHCGKEDANARFQSEKDQLTQRTAAIVTLERYRRVRIVTQYDESDWCTEPLGQWPITLITGAIDTHAIPDPLLKQVIKDELTLDCDVETLKRLEDLGAIPSRSEISVV